MTIITCPKHGSTYAPWCETCRRAAYAASRCTDPEDTQQHGDVVRYTDLRNELAEPYRCAPMADAIPGLDDLDDDDLDKLATGLLRDDREQHHRTTVIVWSVVAAVALGLLAGYLIATLVDAKLPRFASDLLVIPAPGEL